MSDELKPCPFCGGYATFAAHATAEEVDPGVFCRTMAVIGCDRCEFCMSEETDGEAVAKWNTRAAVTDEQFAMAVHDGRAWQVVMNCTFEECHWDDGGHRTWGCRCSACGRRFEHETGVTWNRCPECGAAKAVG